MSGVALTSMSGSELMTAKSDELTKGVLPAPPIALRTFPQNDEIALFAEVYDRPTAQPHAVDITAIVRSDEGTVVFKNEEERQSSELQGSSGGYIYQARVPLTDLQARAVRAHAGGALAARRPPGGDADRSPSTSRRHSTGGARCTGCTGAPGSQGAQGAQGCRGDADARSRGAQQHRRARSRLSSGTRRIGARSGRSMRPSGRCRRSTSRARRWRRCFSGRGRPAGMASRSSGAAEKAGALVVQYRETKPGADAIAAQVITSPFLLVAMPKVDGDVKFEQALPLRSASATASWSYRPARSSSALPSSWSPVLPSSSWPASTLSSTTSSPNPWSASAPPACSPSPA